MLRSLLLAGVVFLVGAGGVLGDDGNTRWMTMADESGEPRPILISGTVPEEVTSRAVVLRDNVTFILYTLSNDARNGSQIFIDDTATLGDYNPANPTKILVHGFWGDLSSSVIQATRRAYFDNGDDFNLIGVDWGVLCPSPFYNLAKDNSLLVGPYVGELVNFLVTQGAALSDVQLIGHSLGGQVVGMAGYAVTGGKVARITGLDPALPLFDTETLDHRLDDTDAVLVDVIHTDGGGLGFLDTVGHIDFYPNGGTAPQPGCGADLSGQCSHTRNHVWYAESILDPLKFPARQCSSQDAAIAGTCDAAFTGQMGDDLGNTVAGIYYLEIVPTP